MPAFGSSCFVEPRPQDLCHAFDVLSRHQSEVVGPDATKLDAAGYQLLPPEQSLAHELLLLFGRSEKQCRY